ncbi:hypothetical protein JYU34_005806 [Plutella xylostella]|uniref:G-protein coupled receptors family 3 profile domain-containing protein n=1 Tax=Plutella xylostella TaxID=51655 RepID=A0ABQ7QU65_PLUXY|nr:hypothetical protein JYU34_005806 [Plutella xylostella]
MRALLAAWLACAACAAAAGAGGAGGARFGDRLAPRVPARYQPRAAPHAALHRADDDYDDPYDEPETEPPPPRRHRLHMSTEYFVLPERASSVAPPPPAPPAPPRPASSPRPATVPPPPPPPPPAGALRPEPWAVPVLALACACMVTLAGFEAFVVWGASRTAPSRRHLLLGQTLLLGLFLCAGTAALLAAPVSAFTCGAVRFGTGVAYVLVFASLLVKCVFLLSLNGGVYLPAAYQGLLLFFAVMIQVAIGAQWLGGAPPRVAAPGRCAAPLGDLLLSLSYAAFLVAVVCAVALRSRGIRDNYREATHILGAGGAAAAVALCWVAAALGAGEALRDACVAAGLLATCAVVFALMFAPKGRRLAALGREGRWDADRDEGLSSLGAAGSGYSPSFFHFKPVKYGMVSAAPQPLALPLDRKDAPTQPAG